MYNCIINVIYEKIWEMEFAMGKVSDLLNNSFNLERNLKQQGNTKYDFNEIMNKQDLISSLDGKHNSTSVVCDEFGTMTTIMIPPKLQEEMAANPEKKKYVDNVIKDFFAQQPAHNSSLAARGDIPTPATITFNEDGSRVESCGSVPSPKKLAEIEKARELKRKKKQEEDDEEQRQIENYYEQLELESKIKYNFQLNKVDNTNGTDNLLSYLE